MKGNTMEQTIDYSADTTVKIRPGQVNVWAPVIQPVRKNGANPAELVDYAPAQGNRQSLGQIHACRISQRSYQKAQDHFKRANRDLGETAAFMLALTTTVTAIEAVINIADTKIHLPETYLRTAFDIYLILFISILILGGLRSLGAIQRRSEAEKELDLAKKGIFDHCPEEQWSKHEE